MASASGERLTREEFLKKKQLDEARKAGTAPAEVDDEGKEINPHIPQYIAQAPWYFGPSKPGLKHQRSGLAHEETSGLDTWYPRGQQAGDAPARFRKGACENCGAMTHKTKFCCERPRKVGARWTGRDMRPDEALREVRLDWAGKRDRWNGYDPSDHTRLMALYEKIDKERREARHEKDLEEAETRLEEVDGERETEGYNNAPIQKLDPKTRTTVRNLRIREDTAKYLWNLDPNSAHYDPKTRSMRDNPLPGANPADLEFAGDNFVRAGGDTVKLAEAQLHALEEEEAGAAASDAPHLLANPSAAELMHREFKDRKERLAGQQRKTLLDRYGGSEHVESLPKELVFAQTESYTEYTRAGQPMRGDKAASAQHAASRWDEDVLIGNHTAVWGSWWHDGRWGFACCHSLVKNSYCTGAAGRAITAAAAALDGEEEAGDEEAQGEQKTLVEEHAERSKEDIERKRLKEEEEHEEKLKRAFEEEARRQKGQAEEEEKDDRKGSKKRKYTGSGVAEVTPEEIEAYQTLRSHREDPMLAFPKEDDQEEHQTADDRRSKKPRV